MATLQVKGLDENLYRALGARAAIEHRSISQQVVTMIQEALSRPPRDPEQATLALLELAGTWEDERSAEQIVADVKKARRSRRRSRKHGDVFA